MPIQQPDIRAAATKVLQRIQNEFPQLTMNLQELEPPNGNMELTIPMQCGMAFEIAVLFEHDELVLVVSSFHAHYDCSSLDEQIRCVDTVLQLINGHFRLKETLRGQTVCKSELQSIDKDEWHTIEVCGIFHLLWFRKKSTRFIVNQENTPSH